MKHGCSQRNCRTRATRKPGLCNMHYQRRLRHGDPQVCLVRRSPRRYPLGELPTHCTRDDCHEPGFATGLCSRHYSEQREWGERGSMAFGLCPICRSRYRTSTGHGVCCRCHQHQMVTARRRLPNGFWDEATCLKAGRIWIDLTDWAPRTTDWRTPGGLFPHYSVVRRVFGTWGNYIEVLGAEPRPKRAKPAVGVA